MIDYDVNEYNFRGLIEWAVGRNLPEFWHQTYSHELYTRENDQSSPFHKRFYDNYYCLESTYKRFIEQVITPLIGEPVVFQKVPSFRVHLVGNVAVGEEHKDSDYSHSTDEQNFWLPITHAYDTNTIWIEGQPQNLNYGQVLHFDGANKMHGNKTNDTPITRVSIDFRVIPLSRYKDSERFSINTELPMKIGGYWDKL